MILHHEKIIIKNSQRNYKNSLNKWETLYAKDIYSDILWFIIFINFYKTRVISTNDYKLKSKIQLVYINNSTLDLKKKELKWYIIQLLINIPSWH